MHMDKAPGPDGFIGRFYKSCWSIIKEDVLMALDVIHRGHVFKFSLLNTAYVTLLPKKVDAVEAKDFHPFFSRIRRRAAYHCIKIGEKKGGINAEVQNRFNTTPYSHQHTQRNTKTQKPSYKNNHSRQRKTTKKHYKKPLTTIAKFIVCLSTPIDTCVQVDTFGANQ